MTTARTATSQDGAQTLRSSAAAPDVAVSRAPQHGSDHHGSGQPGTEVEYLREGFRAPDPAARPMMRWWWFGPDVVREDLLRDLDDMAAAGIGGVECAFVYPMGATSDHFLSETFLADVGFAAEAAEQRGLRFDVTLGSGWPYGGPHIDETTAARRIEWVREEIRTPAQRIPVPAAWPGDEFIAAYIGEGTRGEAPSSFIPLEAERVDGAEQLIIPEGRGPRVVLVALSRPSGQMLKRAAAGAEGWALDHLSAEATRVHIDAVAEPLVEAAGRERIGTVFCDSLEVYDAGWTPSLPEEFATRRGYDPLPHLWQLTLTGEQGRQFRADLHRTQSELVEKNFIGVMREWARSKGLTFRIQSYGQPPVTLSSYRYADAFEGEGWGWDVVTACRWASSAGQHYSQDVISSETWTWNHSPSFRSTPLDILGEAHDHLLMGINHFIGHGWPTSPRPEAESPDRPAELGRVFYASGAFDSRNAWWEAAPQLWGTLHRLSWLMRQGCRLSQVGVYVPARDIYAGFAAAGRIDLYKEARLHIGDELPHVIRTSGLDYDLFDDDAVIATESSLTPERFRVVVLPYATDVPESTRSWLRQVLDAGGTVLDLGGSAGIGLAVGHVGEVPGHALEQPGAAAPVRLAGFDPVSGGPVANRTVAVTTREFSSDGSSEPGSSGGRAHIHFAANTGAAPAEVELTLAGAGRPGVVVERWDPESGETMAIWNEPDPLRLHLGGYEAAVLIQYGGGSDQADGVKGEVGVHAEAEEVAGPVAAPEEEPEGARGWQALELGDWTVQFPDEAAPRPVEIPHRWEEEPARSHYSGSAVYATTVTVPERARTAVLDLGAAQPRELQDPEAAGLMEASFSAEVVPPVGVVAKVIVDGRQAGFLWKTPYRLDLSDYLTGGVHELHLVVYNVTSHRLAADTGIPRLVRQAEESFGRRFGIQTLELALADVSSGLLQTPALHVR